jgi:hypothetical protein
VDRCLYLYIDTYMLFNPLYTELNMSEPCPNCKKQIPIVKCPIQVCPHCKKRHWNSTLGIAFYDSGFECLENPKRHRHPDWIEQWETVEQRQWGF